MGIVFLALQTLGEDGESWELCLLGVVVFALTAGIFIKPTGVTFRAYECRTSVLVRDSTFPLSAMHKDLVDFESRIKICSVLLDTKNNFTERTLVTDLKKNF